MYEVSVTRAFVAQHVLTVPNPGPEGTLHSHQYTVEATVRGPELDEHGYLVDIDHLNEAMDALASRYQDQTLNEFPAFEGHNPSVERLARAFGTRLLERLEPAGATELRVAIDEDDIARVAHERAL